MFTDEIETALTRMQNIDEDETLAEAEEESEAVSALLTAFQHALKEDEMHASKYTQLASISSDELTHHTKTDVKSELRDIVEQETGGDHPELTEWVQDNLDEIVIRRSTDHKQDAEYILRFRGGDTIEAEVTPGSGMPLDSYEWWQDQIRVLGQATADPRLDDDVDFQTWVDEILAGTRGQHDVELNENYRGPRTERVDALRGRIRSGRAFTTLEDAIADGGMYLDEDSGELFVPSERIMDLLDDQPVTANAFRRELVARGLGAERLDGAFAESKSAMIEGERQWEDYWVFDVDVAEPGVVDPDGTDPVAAVQEAVNGGSDDGGDAGAGDEGDADAPSDDDEAEEEEAEEEGGEEAEAVESIDRPAPGGGDAGEDNVVTAEDVADADDSDDDEFGVEAEQVNVADAVKTEIREADADRVDRDAVIDAVTSDHPVDAETVEREINQLKQRGEMYDPSGGELSLT